MDALQKSTEETNIVSLSYLVETILTSLPKEVEIGICTAASLMKNPGVNIKTLHAVNVNNKYCYEMTITGYCDYVSVDNLRKIDDADEYLDHILEKTYTVCNF